MHSYHLRYSLTPLLVSSLIFLRVRPCKEWILFLCRLTVLRWWLYLVKWSSASKEIYWSSLPDSKKLWTFVSIRELRISLNWTYWIPHAMSLMTSILFQSKREKYFLISTSLRSKLKSSSVLSLIMLHPTA